MKLKELITVLQSLEDLNPDAEAHFEWVEPIGNGTTTKAVGLIDTPVLDGQVTIRVTDPIYVEAVRRINR